MGIGQIGELYDLNTQNITLAMVAEHGFAKGKKKVTVNGKVTGYGAVSGRLEGEILALFYRYKSVGGKEYVSDFLIGGRDGKPLNVHHGDSGTLWLFEITDENKKTTLHPIALHWGQHEIVTGVSKKHYGYSLATCLSNLCRKLDVELIRDWNIALDYSWGKIGHYSVGTFAITAIDQVKNKTLKTLMENNLKNISFEKTKINIELTEKDNPELSANPKKGFCPLADVPDIIWKQSKEKTTWGRKGDENPNHYADADAPTKNEGKTLFDICDTQAKLDTKIWDEYYENIDKKEIGMDPKKSISKGLVSFRVWQIFDYMVEALHSKRVDKFIFAAGVLAHYIGDCCQPLHSSYMNNGDPADDEWIDYTAKRDSKHHAKGDVYKKLVNPGDGVHVAYEDNMIDDYIEKILPLLEKTIKDKNSRINKETIETIDSGQAAGFASLKLMQKTQQDIKPKDIVEAYKKAKNEANISYALYEEFGALTIDCLARGCVYLAAIWEAAWVEGDGAKNITKTGRVDDGELRKLYSNPKELPSMYLDTIGDLLK